MMLANNKDILIIFRFSTCNSDVEKLLLNNDSVGFDICESYFIFMVI